MKYAMIYGVIRIHPIMPCYLKRLRSLNGKKSLVGLVDAQSLLLSIRRNMI